MRKPPFNNLHFSPILLIDSFENRLQHVINDIHSLIIIIPQGHLQIQSHILRQMSMCIAILRTKYRSNFIDTIKVRCKGHLFHQLRALRQICRSVKVFDFKDTGSGFRGTCLEFWSMDLDEILVVEDGAEDVADGGVDAEDGLSGWGTEFEEAVRKTL